MADARDELHDSLDMTSRLHNLSGWFADDSSFEARSLSKFIENPIGLATIPLAVAGPMLFNGHHAQGFIAAPVATTEGALVASICRGAKAMTLSGGIHTSASQQRMSVAPMFVCETPAQAAKLGDWMENNKDRIQREVITPVTSRKQLTAILKEVMPVTDLDVSWLDCTVGLVLSACTCSVAGVSRAASFRHWRLRRAARGGGVRCSRDAVRHPAGGQRDRREHPHAHA